jgi:UDP-GlcNAc:undecaprenyl-phosphate GlcNAc-1-phosphate transferase
LSVEFRVLLAFLVPLAISFRITSLMIRWAPVLGLVDIPNARKVHSRPIPKGGGLAIFIGWLSGALLLGLNSKELWVWGGIGSIVVVLGLIDDIRPLPWQSRLSVQIIAAIVGAWVIGRIQPKDSSSLALYWIWPAVVIWIVGLTNAFNMLDNMDVLSGGVAWIAAALFFEALLFVPLYKSEYSIPLAPLMLMGALTGFLWFNRSPARIFMGDAGSTFLGFFFGTSSLLFAGVADRTPPATHHGASPSTLLILLDMFEPAPWALLLCFLAIPWYDLVSVVSIRLWQGRSPFHADKQHLSHRLVALGLSPSRAVGMICLLAVMIGAGGLLLYHLVRNHGSTLALVFVVGCWVVLAGFEILTRGKRQIADNHP